MIEAPSIITLEFVTNEIDPKRSDYEYFVNFCQSPYAPSVCDLALLCLFMPSVFFYIRSIQNVDDIIETHNGHLCFCLCPLSWRNDLSNVFGIDDQGKIEPDHIRTVIWVERSYSYLMLCLGHLMTAFVYQGILAPVT